MEVHFYSGFKKRKNSTLRPSGDGQIIECILKRGTSVVKPVLQVRISYQAAWNNYNYCYIPDFGRYYYIEDLTWDNALASFTLSTDLFATFKSDIGAFSGLAVRSSSVFDGTIPDPLLPPTDDISISTNTAYRAATYSYVISGAGGDGVSLIFKSSLNDIGEQLNSFWSKITNQITGINACYRTLLREDEFTTEGDPLSKNAIGFGVAAFTIPGKRLYLIPGKSTFLTGLTLNPHPQASTYGAFLNSATYRQAYIYNSGIGFSQLPITANDVGDVELKGIYSPDNGATSLEIFVNNRCLKTVATNLYAAIPFCGSSVNISGMVNGAAGFAGGLGTAVAASNPGTAIAAGVSAGVSAVAGAVSGIPTGSIAGVLSGVSTLDNAYTIVEIFRKVKDNDNLNRGRPLLKNRTASSGGYIEYERVNLNTTARGDEKTEIENTMERGFYYE